MGLNTFQKKVICITAHTQWWVPCCDWYIYIGLLLKIDWVILSCYLFCPVPSHLFGTFDVQSSLFITSTLSIFIYCSLCYVLAYGVLKKVLCLVPDIP